MPDKQNDNKLMAMLERRGIVRKAGSEDEQAESAAESAASPQRSESDIRVLFDSPASDSPKVTPAARQPVPGMSNPVLSGEHAQNTAREQPQHLESRVVDLPKINQSYTDNAEADDLSKAVPESVISVQPVFPEPVSKVQPPPTAQSQSSYTDEFEEFSVDMPRDGSAVTIGDLSAPEYLRQPSAADYTDRFLDIESLYEVLSLKSKRTDTVYLVEEYLKTLPDSLPDDSRREIVTKIVAASGFDFDLLMGDGVLRVKMLKDYAEQFARYTDEYVAARQAELEQLDQQILRVRKLIENRRELHKKQFFAIEAEAQRLKEILEFIG